MIVKLLMIDDQPSGDDFITDPSLEDIITSFKQLNGHNHTYIGLYKEEEPNMDEFMLVGGGTDKYVCSYYKDGDEYYLTNNDINEPDKLVEIPIGQMNIKPLKYVSSNPDEIIHALEAYYTTGEMAEDLHWEMS